MVDQLSLLVRQLTTSQRIGIAFGTFASALLLVGFVMWAGRPDYQPAFSRLATSDAAGIAEALRGAKIPFEVADAGSTILVPGGQLSAARVAAAAAGIATEGATGFELFDKQNFGASEFEQNVAYQRALEGKLTRTIEGMAGVADATVSVVALQQGLFADQDRPASASVNLRMRDGVPPDPAMVRGIVSTVAGAVAGLSADNVTVVDERGRVLAGPADAMAGDPLALQSTVERGIAAKIQAMVDGALGPGHASVAVSADIDLDKVEQTVTTIKPIDSSNWTPTSVQTVGETYAGTGGTGAGGIPGALSNVPGLPTYPGLPAAGPEASTAPDASAAPDASTAPDASAAPTAAGYVRQQQTVNYANSQTIEKIIRQPGAIRRLSVAVLLDQAALGSMSPDGLKQTLEAAIGADAARGDVVSVSAVEFGKDAGAGAAGDAAAAGGLDDMIGMVTGIASSALGVVVALVLLLLVWRNLRALHGRAEDMQLLNASFSRQGLLEANAGGAGGSATAGFPEIEPSREAQVGERVRRIANEKPDAVAGLVNGWIREEARR